MGQYYFFFRQLANNSKLDKTEIGTYKFFLQEMESFEHERTGKSGMRWYPVSTMENFFAVINISFV